MSKPSHRKNWGRIRRYFCNETELTCLSPISPISLKSYVLHNMVHSLLLPKTLLGCAPRSEANPTTKQGKFTCKNNLIHCSAILT